MKTEKCLLPAARVGGPISLAPSASPRREIGVMLFYDTYVFAHIKILCEAFYDTYPCTYFSTNLFMLHPIYIHTFFGRLLLLPTHKYTYFEKHFYATHPTLCKALHAIYIHIMQGILFNFLQGILFDILQGISMLYIYIYTYR